VAPYQLTALHTLWLPALPAIVAVGGEGFKRAGDWGLEARVAVRECACSYSSSYSLFLFLRYEAGDEER